ncbi:MAG: beta-lactamase family protein [Chloroflexi bacterium]|nr:beta-lactamase family protein [Chloroflexota bacterium]
MKRTWFKIGLLIFVLLGTACQQQRAAYDALSQVMDEQVADDGPGVVLLVRNGRIGEQIFAGGLSDWEEPTAARTVNHFRIGGLTKTFISTLVIQMVTEGKLSLDDTLAQHLPDTAAHIPHSEQITIRQLLNMTSGIVDYRDNPAFWEAVLTQEKRGWQPDEVIVYAYDLPPTAVPGETFHYSNSNTILLQMILNTALEEELSDELRDRILDRVDMPDTYLEPIARTTGGHIGGYGDIDGDGTVESLLSYDDGRGLGDLGLISNAIDLGVFATALYERTLPGDDGREQTLATVPMPNGDEYGLGIMRRHSEWGEMWGYASVATGFTSQMWFLPDRDTTVVVLINAEEVELADELVTGALTAVIEE